MVRLFALLSTLLAGPVLAQDYHFSIPEYICNASLETDGTLLINYEIELLCESGADALDIIDVSFATGSYEMDTFIASIDGQPIGDIRESSQTPVGIELRLGSQSIEPGQSVVLRLSGRNPGVVQRDYSAGNRASVQLSPIWLDDSLLVGESHFVLRFLFPPGADSLSVRYVGRRFTRAYAIDDRIAFEWEENRRVSSEYLVGVSFPAGLVTCELQEAPRTTTPARQNVGGMWWKPGPGCYIVPALMVTVLVTGFLLSGRRGVVRLRCRNCGNQIRIQNPIPGESVKCGYCGGEVEVPPLAVVPGKEGNGEDKLMLEEPDRYELAALRELIICPHCHCPSRIQEGKCPDCGAVLRRPCPTCGKLVDKRMETCPNCGSNLRSAPDSSAGYRDISPEAAGSPPPLESGPVDPSKALVFRCVRCGQEVAVFHLRRGDIALCRACGARAPIPNDAVEVSKDAPTYLLESTKLRSTILGKRLKKSRLCASCGAVIERGAMVCQACGASCRTCPICGAHIDARGSICPGCGVVLGDDSWADFDGV